jgi:hypothetical protein
VLVPFGADLDLGGRGGDGDLGHGDLGLNFGGDFHGLGVLALGGAGLGGAGLGVLSGGHARVGVPPLVQFLAGVLAGDFLAPGPKAVLADVGGLAGLAEQVAPADCVRSEVVRDLVHLPLGADGRAAVALAACLAVALVAAVEFGDGPVALGLIGRGPHVDLVKVVIGEFPQVPRGGDVHIDNLCPCL